MTSNSKVSDGSHESAGSRSRHRLVRLVSFLDSVRLGESEATSPERHADKGNRWSYLQPLCPKLPRRPALPRRKEL